MTDKFKPLYRDDTNVPRIIRDKVWGKVGLSVSSELWWLVNNKLYNSYQNQVTVLHLNIKDLIKHEK